MDTRGTSPFSLGTEFPVYAEMFSKRLNPRAGLKAADSGAPGGVLPYTKGEKDNKASLFLLGPRLHGNAVARGVHTTTAR